MPRGATQSPLACRAVIPARTGDRVGRATAHRQDDGVHAVDAALGTRARVGDDDGRALDGDQCRVQRQRHARAEQARREWHDRRHTDVLPWVEEPRDPSTCRPCSRRHAAVDRPCCVWTSTTTTTRSPASTRAWSTSRSGITGLPSRPGSAGTCGCDPVTMITTSGALGCDRS